MDSAPVTNEPGGDSVAPESPPHAGRLFPGPAGSVGLVLLFWALQALFGVALFVAVRGGWDDPMAGIAVANLVATWLVLRRGMTRNRGRWRGNFTWRLRPWWIAAPAGLIVLGAFTLCDEIASQTLRWLEPPAFLAGLFSGTDDRSTGGGATLVLFLIVAPLTEELIFRGLMLRGLLDHVRPAAAIALSALLFSIAHANPWQFGSTLILGTVLGWIYVRTRSVGLCIAAHAFHNALAIFAPSALAAIPDLGAELGDTSLLVQPWWFVLGGLPVAAAGIWWLQRFPPVAAPASEVPAPPPEPPVAEPNPPDPGAPSAGGEPQ